ncbi:MAG: endonuclease III [Eubacteriales bacterium]|nr:endonuclease III [Eubacteriales bacterium]
MDKKIADKIIKLLDEYIPNPVTELEYNSDFQLLVAVILSAQCTDKRVNIVTKELFKQYKTPQDFANMDLATLERLIHPCGFYHNKAVNIINCSKMIVEKFNGQVPTNFDDLVSLPGVGRKTANVMLIVAFNTPAIPVDTHIFRVSNRLGLTNAKNETECEEQLVKLFADKKELWGKIHHLILLYGRYNCKAINPMCDNCIISQYCKYYNKH